jgi:hypothetical protein
MAIAYAHGTAWIGAFGGEHKQLYGPQGPGASWLFSVKFGATGPRRHRYRLETGDLSGPVGVAVGYGKVWVLNRAAGPLDNQKLIEFDPHEGRVVKRIPLGARNHDALAVGAGSVWVVDQVKSTHP